MSMIVAEYFRELGGLVVPKELPPLAHQQVVVVDFARGMGALLVVHGSAYSFWGLELERVGGWSVANGSDGLDLSPPNYDGQGDALLLNRAASSWFPPMSGERMTAAFLCVAAEVVRLELRQPSGTTSTDDPRRFVVVAAPATSDLTAVTAAGVRYPISLDLLRALPGDAVSPTARPGAGAGRAVSRTGPRPGEAGADPAG